MAIMQSVSILPVAMTANANVGSLEIHLPCAHRVKPMLDAKIPMNVYAVTLSLARLDIVAKMVDA